MFQNHLTVMHFIIHAPQVPAATAAGFCGWPVGGGGGPPTGIGAKPGGVGKSSTGTGFPALFNRMASCRKS